MQAGEIRLQRPFVVGFLCNQGFFIQIKSDTDSFASFKISKTACTAVIKQKRYASSLITWVRCFTRILYVYKSMFITTCGFLRQQKNIWRWFLSNSLLQYLELGIFVVLSLQKNFCLCLTEGTASEASPFTLQ